MLQYTCFYKIDFMRKELLLLNSLCEEIFDRKCIDTTCSTERDNIEKQKKVAILEAVESLNINIEDEKILTIENLPFNLRVVRNQPNPLLLLSASQYSIFLKYGEKLTHIAELTRYINYAKDVFVTPDSVRCPELDRVLGIVQGFIPEFKTREI
jgi:hypothetical protein